MTFCFKETIKQKNPRAIAHKFLLQNWFKIITSRIFICYALCSGFVSAGFFAYVTVSPSVLREIYGISAFGYGLVFAFLAFCFVISNLIAGQLVIRVGQFLVIAIGEIMVVLAGGIMLVLSILGVGGPFTIIIPTAIYFFGIGWIVPQSNARALQPFENSAGTASALLGFISMIISALMGFSLSFVIHENATYLAFAMLVSSFISFLIYFLIIKKITNQ